MAKRFRVPLGVSNSVSKYGKFAYIELLTQLKIWANGAKRVFIWVSVSPKEVESVEISHSPESLLHTACKIRFQNLPRQIETNVDQHNFDESRSEQIWMCLDLTNFLQFLIQGHTSGERNLPYYPSVETDRDNNFKPN